MKTQRPSAGRAALLLAILLVGVPRADAQFASAIEGTVSDSSGGVVPAAAVTLTNKETGAVQNVSTNEAGYYRFSSLGNGLYSVRVTLQGFRTVIQDQIQLQVAETRTVNLQMAVGAAAEEVTVQATAALIETSQGRVSGLIEESQIKDLPLVGRNFFSLVVLTPGVLGRATGGTQAYAQSSADLYSNEFGVNMNANGARTESNNFLIDSSTVSSSQRSGVVNINPNTESVQEVRVSVNNFSAEYGRNGSVLVNIVTKSGTNNLHGAGSSSTRTTTSRPKTNSSGRRLAGLQPQGVLLGSRRAARKNRTFFFASGDVLRSNVAISRDTTVITPALRAVHAAEPAEQRVDVRRQLVSGLLHAGPQPAHGRAAPQRILLRFDADYFSDRFDSLRLSSDRGRHLERIVSTRTVCSGRRESITPSTAGAIGSTVRSTARPRTKSASASRACIRRSPRHRRRAAHTSTRTTPRFCRRRCSMRRRSRGCVPAAELTNPHPEVPGITIGGLTGYQQGFGPNEFVQNSFEWRDVVTWTRGSHNLKIGGAYTREHADNDSSRTYNRPTYDFNNVFDFANDNPRQQAQVRIEPAHRRRRAGADPATTAPSRSRRSSRTTGRCDQTSA